jgi:hypothetical protein
VRSFVSASKRGLAEEHVNRAIWERATCGARRISRGGPGVPKVRSTRVVVAKLSMAWPAGRGHMLGGPEALGVAMGELLQPMAWRVYSVVILVLLLGVGLARADAEAHAYGLVIGASRGGQGQSPLRYATADAVHVADVLTQLGRTPREHVTQLIDPSPAAVLAALTRLSTQLTEHARAGQSSQLFFYYSGHARANALSLGAAELSLDTLRKALLALPSTLTVVVLDACQSGAFSGVKGAVPAADFSSSSYAQLSQAGVAVMASSTAEELSQESEDIGGSYFTHHLLTGLRGAADRDVDGSVSLDEAYAYAYQHTLSDTLRTRFGSQHATLETTLKGHGKVPLTYIRDVDAKLRLSAELTGRVVVQHQGRGAIVAELNKAEGSVLVLALPHGPYEVLLRPFPTLSPRVCAVSLEQATVQDIDPRACPVVLSSEALAAKGFGEVHEGWFFELEAQRRFVFADAYTRTLSEFRFVDHGEFTSAGDRGNFSPAISVGRGLSPHISVLARLQRVARRRFERHVAEDQDHDDLTVFSWDSWGVMAGVRAGYPQWQGRFVPFVEIGAGLGVASSKYRAGNDVDTSEAYAGFMARAAVGATLDVAWGIGLQINAGYDYAAPLRNEVGERRNDGGPNVGLALRYRLLKGQF